MNTQEEITIVCSPNLDGTATITNITFISSEPVTELAIPAEVEVDGKRLRVTGLQFDYDTCKSLEGIKKVSLPEGLVFIGHNCFSHTTLEQINFPLHT